MSARNRVFVILGLLTLGSLIWYLVTSRPPSDLHLIGTVDANEVEVSSKIPGRIQQLTVEEGQQVKAGDLIAVIESDDLAAAEKAAQATVQSQRARKIGEDALDEGERVGTLGVTREFGFGPCRRNRLRRHMALGLIAHKRRERFAYRLYGRGMAGANGGAGELTGRLEVWMTGADDRT